MPAQQKTAGNQHQLPALKLPSQATPAGSLYQQQPSAPAERVGGVAFYNCGVTQSLKVMCVDVAWTVVPGMFVMGICSPQAHVSSAAAVGK